MSNRPTQQTIAVEVEIDTYIQTETVAGSTPGLNRVGSTVFGKPRADEQGYDEDDEKARDLESVNDGQNEQASGYHSQSQLTHPQSH